MKIIASCPDYAVILKPLGMDSEKEVPKELEKLLGGKYYPVHRLDKNVGGLMVYARSSTAAAALSKAVQNGQFTKEYFALVHGSTPVSGEMEDFLFKDSTKNKVFVVKKERKGVKKARLSYRKLSEKDGCSLVRVHLFTGRSHQIRVQFASRGFPLVGDRRYGGKDAQNAPMLYSCALEFPFGGSLHRFDSVPQWAAALCENLH